MKAIKIMLILLLAIVISCENTTTTYVKREVKEGNEPFLLEANSSKSCLLIHGLGASPWEMRKLGNALYHNNITVYALLLKGHGTSVEDLENTTWREWYNDVENGYSLLKSKKKEVYICGFSMGAVLGGLIAENKETKGIISVSAPITLKDKRVEFIPILKNFVQYEDVSLTDDEIGHYYDKRPTSSVIEMFKLIEEYKKGVGNITEPIMVIQSESDEIVDKESAYFIYNNVNSNLKEMRLIKDKPHFIIKEDEVVNEIVDFIQNN